MSYALYGIFGVTLGANYGEGHEGARQRLLAATHFQDNLAAQQASEDHRMAFAVESMLQQTFDKPNRSTLGG